MIVFGGRFILVKYVLESITVYWLLMAQVPKLILENIRHKKIKFLLIGKKETEGVHLVKWERLDWNKIERGHGLNNIFN